MVKGFIVFGVVPRQMRITSYTAENCAELRRDRLLGMLVPSETI